MASVQTSSYDGRYLKLTVVEESWSIADNSSTIRWTLESIGGASATYYTIYNWGVWVGGNTIYGQQTTAWNSYNFPAGKGSTTGTFKVYHRADGTADNVGFTLKGSVYYNRNNSYDGSIALTHIPRYTTVNQSVRSTSDNSFQMNWTTTDKRDWTQYSLNGGAWTDAGDVVASDGKSGYYTISGLTPSTSYTIKTRCRRQDSQLWSETSAITVTTLGSPYISALSDFNIGSSLACTIYNPKSRNLTLKLLTSGGTEIASRSTSVNGTYTFVFTGAENDALYNAIPNSPSGQFRISVYCSDLGTTNYSNSSVGWKTFYAVESACSPEVEISAIDCNVKSLALTGDANTVIKYVSDVLTEITAYGSKSAKIKTVIIQCSDGQSQTYSTDAGTVTKSKTFESVENAVYSCSVVDSRGFTKTVSIALGMVSYIPLTLNADVYRPSPTNGNIAVKFKGNVFNDNFGSVDNTLIVKYRYKEHGTDVYSAWVELNPVKNGNTYSNGTGEITLGTNFDYQKSFDFEFVALDKIYDDGSISSYTVVLDGRTIYDWGKDDFNINGKLNIYETSIIRHIANILWPVDSIYTSLTQDIPDYMAGEWALYDTLVNNGKTYYIYKRTSEDEKLYYQNIELLYNGEEIYIENTLLKGDDVL